MAAEVDFMSEDSQNITSARWGFKELGPLTSRETGRAGRGEEYYTDDPDKYLISQNCWTLSSATSRLLLFSPICYRSRVVDQYMPGSSNVGQVDRPGGTTRFVASDRFGHTAADNETLGYAAGKRREL